MINNPEVTKVKYPFFFLLFMISMVAFGMATLGLMIWERQPGAVYNMNTTVAFTILSAGMFSNVILLGALINTSEKHDLLAKKSNINERN